MKCIPSPIRIVTSVITLVLLFSSPSYAALLNITNAGFEDNSVGVAFNEFTFGAPNGWTLYEEPGLDTDGGDGPDFYIGTLTPQDDTNTTDPNDYVFFPGGAAERNRVGIAFNYQGRTNSGSGLEYGMFQSLSDTLQANTQYTLQVEIGNITSGTSVSNDFFNLDGFPGYRVDLMAGSNILDSDNNTLAGSIAEGAWGTSTVSFTTGASHTALGQNLGIRLVNLNVTDNTNASTQAADLEVDFDNVRLDATAVPEPSTVMLMLLGLASLFAPRRRSKYFR